MSETLLIHYNIENPQQATWSSCNDAGELTGKITSGSLELLSDITGNHRAIVLLNSQCLHINQLQLPAMNQQKMLKAVPFAIEEFIAEDIENFHFVISKNKHNELTSVVGIDRDTLQKIVDTFQQAGINIEKIIPDALCLAANDKQWACLNYLEDTYLQTDTLSGMLIPHEILAYVITQKLSTAAAQTPEKILLFNEQDNSTAFETMQAAIKQQSGEDLPAIEIINIVYNQHPLVIFCGNYKQALPLNLLQHDFKPKRKSSGYWQHWRLAASLAAVWLVLSLGMSAFQRAQLQAENNIIRAKIEKIYKTAFPESRKIVNPRVQMEQKLKELKSNAGGNNNGLIFLLAESFGTLQSDKKHITLQSLTFRNNRMEIGLDGNNLQAIENLNNSLNSNSNIHSEITSSSSEKDRVRGNLRIEGKS